MTNTVAVIPDIHGHHDQLWDCLTRLGVNTKTLEIPENLTIIQVGDLIHKGPDSTKILHLVEALMLINGKDRWVQLIGNHEANYLNGVEFQTDTPLSPEDTSRLENWAAEGYLVAAAAATSAQGRDTLITHAGLTYNMYKDMLGAPTTALEAATRLNNDAFTPISFIWDAGEMLYPEADQYAGVFWASAGAELYPSWVKAEQAGEEAPFHQIHGHSSAMDWGWGNKPADFRTYSNTLGGPILAEEVKNRLVVYTGKRHTRIEAAGKQIVGIDPNHNRRAVTTWEPFIFEGTAVAPTPETLYTPSNL